MKYVGQRHFVIIIETGQLCANVTEYDKASHDFWTELYAILRRAESPFYKRVKTVSNIECEASYCMEKGLTYTLLIEVECVATGIADLSKPGLEKVLIKYWGPRAQVVSKSVVPSQTSSLIQQAQVMLERTPVTFAHVGAPEDASTEAAPSTETDTEIMVKEEPPPSSSVDAPVEPPLHAVTAAQTN